MIIGGNLKTYLAMNISQEGKEFLTQLEGGMFRNCYIDSGGEPTIGVGHLLTHSERAAGKVWLGEETVDYRDGPHHRAMLHAFRARLADCYQRDQP